ncbi:hypothetical protein ACIQFZ_43525, partial [Streptomyces sp. NPDC093064]|uniref:hypothetical protein n=1 Tax=Streptomyces sp. NPDC093064 TaxID=3366020 RepID=UPI0038083819
PSTPRPPLPPPLARIRRHHTMISNDYLQLPYLNNARLLATLTIATKIALTTTWANMSPVSVSPHSRQARPNTSPCA